MNVNKPNANQLSTEFNVKMNLKKLNEKKAKSEGKKCRIRCEKQIEMSKFSLKKNGASSEKK